MYQPAYYHCQTYYKSVDSGTPHTGCRQRGRHPRCLCPDPWLLSKYLRERVHCTAEELLSSRDTTRSILYIDMGRDIVYDALDAANPSRDASPSLIVRVLADSRSRESKWRQAGGGGGGGGHAHDSGRHENVVGKTTASRCRGRVVTGTGRHACDTEGKDLACM